jgi:hypothetical protein
LDERAGGKSTVTLRRAFDHLGFRAVLAVGDQVPDAQVWLAPREPVGLHEIFESGPVLLLFYLFDWSGT